MGDLLSRDELDNSYYRVQSGTKTVYVCGEDSAAIQDALLSGSNCVPVDAGGRGAVFRFPLTSGYGIIRKYRRGGLMQSFLRDRYSNTRRFVVEFRILSYLRKRDFPVPEPLGVGWEQQGKWFRGAIATRELEATDLLDFLASSSPGAESVVHNIGAVIRRMHDLGVVHADLQTRNILISGREVFLIDFDKAELCKEVSQRRRLQNLLRLRRSLEKHLVPSKVFAAISAGYGVTRFPIWLDVIYRIRGRVSDLVRGVFTTA
ncbi:MAG: hypothetical protein HY706_15955 [Candidatus Hydrogenedentes bacterium]|nr:hypothetical protein [Candidatus Hydrogenedentota bacterium]